MKKIILFYCALMTMSACADNSQQEQFQQLASIKIKALAGNLKKELSSSMQSGGPVAAVQTCNIKAPQITEALNDSLTIKRTSLKLRNPNNAPDAWEKKILTAFQQKLAGGTPVEQLVHSEKIKTSSGSQLRMMRAIPTQGFCLSCHGDKQTMSKELAETLKQFYPHDLATGYQAGQIRGAFSVTQTIEN